MNKNQESDWLVFNGFLFNLWSGSSITKLHITINISSSISNIATIFFGYIDKNGQINELSNSGPISFPTSSTSYEAYLQWSNMRQDITSSYFKILIRVIPTYDASTIYVDYNSSYVNEKLNEICGFSFTNDYSSGLTITNVNSNFTNTVKIPGDLKLGLPTAGTGTAVYATSDSGVYKLVRNSSSQKYKYDIIDFNLGLNAVLKLKPRQFKWKSDNKEDFGFIAEEVEEIDDKLVLYQDDIVDGVKYSQMVALLTNAIKEQQEQINYLKDHITLKDKNTDKSYNISIENGNLIMEEI